MEFHLRLGGLRRHLGGLKPLPPSPTLVTSLEINTVQSLPSHTVAQRRV